MNGRTPQASRIALVLALSVYVPLWADHDPKDGKEMAPRSEAMTCRITLDDNENESPVAFYGWGDYEDAIGFCAGNHQAPLSLAEAKQVAEKCPVFFSQGAGSAQAAWTQSRPADWRHERRRQALVRGADEAGFHPKATELDQRGAILCGPRPFHTEAIRAITKFGGKKTYAEARAACEKEGMFLASSDDLIDLTSDLPSRFEDFFPAGAASVRVWDSGGSIVRWEPPGARRGHFRTSVEEKWPETGEKATVVCVGYSKSFVDGYRHQFDAALDEYARWVASKPQRDIADLIRARTGKGPNLDGADFAPLFAVRALENAKYRRNRMAKEGDDRKALAEVVPLPDVFDPEQLQQMKKNALARLDGEIRKLQVQVMKNNWAQDPLIAGAEDLPLVQPGSADELSTLNARRYAEAVLAERMKLLEGEDRMRDEDLAAVIPDDGTRRTLTEITGKRLAAIEKRMEAQRKILTPPKGAPLPQYYLGPPGMAAPRSVPPLVNRDDIEDLKKGIYAGFKMSWQMQKIRSELEDYVRAARPETRGVSGAGAGDDAEEEREIEREERREELGRQFERDMQELDLEDEAP